MVRFSFCSVMAVVLTIGVQAGSLSAEPASLAREVLQIAEIDRGFCSVVGSGDDAVAMDIVESSRFMVHVLGEDAEKVAVAREKADAAGLYGDRLLIERHSFEVLPYADNLVDLIVVPRWDKASVSGVSIVEIARALRPGGRAVLRTSTDVDEAAVAKKLARRLKKEMGGESLRAKGEFGQWVVWTKPEPEGVDDWSHWNHGPDNNPMSVDAVIRAPYRTQWVGGPLYSTMPTVTTAAGGRVFLATGHIAHHPREEPLLNKLIARNGYNGTMLWRRDLPEGYMSHRSAFIATDDVFYMIDGARCLQLDPQTGSEMGEIRIDGLDGEWKWIVIEDGVLYALAGEKSDDAEITRVHSKGRGWGWGNLSKGYYEERVPWGFGRNLAAYDLKKEKRLWLHVEENEMDSRAMAMGDGKIFFYAPAARVGCLKAKSGKVAWTNDDPDTLELIEHKPDKEKGEKTLGSTPGFRSSCFSLYSPEALVFEAQTRSYAVALSPKNGEYLWHRQKTTSNPNLLYVDGRILLGLGGKWGTTEALDPLTGETLEGLGFNKWACTRLTGSPDSLFVRGEGLRRYDRASKKSFVDSAVRPSCTDGAIPANGLLYVGPWLCDCNLQLLGTVAMCSAGGVSTKPLSGPRLEVSDEGDVAPFEITDGDWPTYRVDNARSMRSVSSAPTQLDPLWTFRPQAESAPSVPTAAGGLVFYGDDKGKVRAIDAATGDERWRFLTGGPIRVPPTIAEGRAYVGSGDGWVYALEAATGRLLWRYLAAPNERRILLYGRLCSNWPVNSGVLVEDGVAYAAAGLIDFDGTRVCALDAKTGEAIWVNDESGILNEETRKGVSAQGHLAIANGKLWLAAGNAVSPAIFDLESGKCLNVAPPNSSGRANRGQEILVVGNHVLYGGKTMFSSMRNVVESVKFGLARSDWDPATWDRVRYLGHRVPPVWDDEVFVSLDGKKPPALCFERGKIDAFLAGQTAEEAVAARAKLAHSARVTKGVQMNKAPKPLWAAAALKGLDTVAMALTPKAVIAVVNVPAEDSAERGGAIMTLGRERGELMTTRALAGEPLPGGLLVDRDGRVVVALQDGSLVCFGERD